MPNERVPQSAPVCSAGMGDKGVDVRGEAARSCSTLLPSMPMKAFVLHRVRGKQLLHSLSSLSGSSDRDQSQFHEITKTCHYLRWLPVISVRLLHLRMRACLNHTSTQSIITNDRIFLSSCDPIIAKLFFHNFITKWNIMFIILGRNGGVTMAKW